MESKQQQESQVDKESQEQGTTQDQDEDPLQQVKELSAQEEDTLMQFLMKISKACKDDNSVPDFVGSQVTDWLKELEVKQEQQPKSEENV